MSHPRSFELEAFACGDGDAHLAQVARHLTECDACRTYVARASALTAPPMRPLTAPPPTATMRAPRRAPIVLAMAATFTLAAAAAWLVQARGDHRAVAHAPPAAPDTPAEPVARNDGPTTSAGETAFKGGVQLALVRDRRGVQERLTGTARVRPGDKLRFEIALDHADAVVAGVLQDDGTFVPVLDDAPRSAGTHYSERALGVDGTPTNGYALAGPRAAIDAARRRGDLTGVASIRITWEAAP